MAAVISVSGNVVDDAGVMHERVYLSVRQNIAQLRDSRAGGSLIAERDQVTSVGTLRQNQRTITFADGSTWELTVSRRPCNCGGRRR